MSQLPLPDTLRCPATTLAGVGVIRRMADETAVFGSRGMIVHGGALNARGRLEALLDSFPKTTAVITHLHRGKEPTVDEVDDLRQSMRAHDLDWVAAVGGGSVLDLAKAAAGLLYAPDSSRSYQQGTAIPAPRLPFIAAPTTAGTGSEATIVAVLTDTAGPLKQSIRHPGFMARCVLLDPDLLAGCPPTVIAASGMDALTQAIESFLSRHATPLTRALSELAVSAIAASLPRVYDGDARAAPALLQGSYLAGLALSHARLGVVHGLAHPLGARLGVAHGQLCALCLPHALKFNRSVCRQDFDRIETLLGADPVSLAQKWIDQFGLRQSIPLMSEPECEAIVRETLASGSTAANPRPVTAAAVVELLHAIRG